MEYLDRAGVERVRRKEHARAVGFTSAIGLDPTSAALRTNRAAGDRPDPSWAKGHYRAGAALAAMDRHAEAADAFRAGLTLDPSNQMLAQGLAAAEKAIADTPVDAADGPRDESDTPKKSHRLGSR